MDFFKRKKNKDDKSAYLKALASELFRPSSHSGASVIRNDATSFSALDLIASSFACLSGSFYDKLSREAVKEHYLYDLLQKPNFDEDKFLFFYSSALDYYDGNVYWYKQEVEGNIVSLFRLNSLSVWVQRDPITNLKKYIYAGETYTDEQVIHIPSRFGYNGLKGFSIFDECGNVFARNRELDDYVNNSFNNSVGNRLVIDISKKYPKPTQEDIDALRAMFNAHYAGVNNAGNPLVKSDEIGYDVIDTNSKDNRSNQLIENRQFQEQEIAKLFRVPLAFLKGVDIKEQEVLYTAFIENAIRPLATNFEQAINRLIPYEDRAYLYFEYSYNSLIKTSLQARIEAYTKQLTNGTLSINEVRQKENLPEIEAGNYHFFPANMMPVTEDVIQAYMAKSKEVEHNLESATEPTEHNPLGDDKT
jgi:HK97 family phage portal protein